MQRQIVTAQTELAANLVRLRSKAHADSGLLAQGEAQIGTLAVLQQQIDNANPFALAMMAASVAASIATSQSLAQQAQTTAGAVQNNPSAQLAQASASARGSVASFMDDYYGNRIFDPYLRFSSEKDEEEFRKREAERQKAIKEALARDTPEGVLEANRLSLEQLKDAGAHGADRSPDYQKSVEGLRSTGVALKAEIGNTDQSRAREIAADQSAEGKCPAALPAHLVASIQKSGITSTSSGTPEGPAASLGAVAACLDQLRR